MFRLSRFSENACLPKLGIIRDTSRSAFISLKSASRNPVTKKLGRPHQIIRASFGRHILSGRGCGVEWTVALRFWLILPPGEYPQPWTTESASFSLPSAPMPSALSYESASKCRAPGNEECPFYADDGESAGPELGRISDFFRLFPGFPESPVGRTAES